VSWYVVPHTTTLTYEGKQVNAYWIGGPDRIVLADAYREDGPTVRHEMLHALLHHAGHPRSAFLTACGGVVACQGDCATEAGGYLLPSAAAPELQPRDLGTRVDVIAPLPAEVLDSGAVAVMITIANPRSEPAWVRLKPRAPGDLRYRTFGLVVDYDDPARIVESSAGSAPAELISLGANETRHWVWNGTLGRGRFGFLGFFNADSAARQVISVGQ
jgi:hypothetical protein